jgi:hypothetical protein
MSLIVRSLSPLLILICASVVAGQWKDPFEANRDSLKGLSPLILKVDYGFMNDLPDDPTEREVADLVKQRLAAFGINVTIQSDETREEPTLLFHLFFMNFDIFYHSSTVQLEVIQQVSLSRDSTLKLAAPTWFADGGTASGTPGIRNEVLAVADQFICDFRKANPGIKAPLPECPAKDSMDRSEVKTGRRASVMTALEEKLIRASALNEVNDAKLLIANGANVNASDHGNATALWYAVRTGNRNIGDTRLIDLLLARGADPNITAECRLTPLMHAVDRGDATVVRVLLEHGADVNGVTAEGYTALMAAAALGWPEIVSILLNQGASITAKARDGRTALAMALSNRNRIAPAPYVDIPMTEKVKLAQAKHDRVAQLLRAAGEKD